MGRQNKRELPIPSAAEIAKMAPRLTEWTYMAARAYGFYAGINAAIGVAADPSSDGTNHASHLRQQLALMAVIRVFAVLDASSDVSFQQVHRYVRANLAEWDMEDEKKSRNKAAHRFEEAYGEIKWPAFRELQRFRNGAIAHVSKEELESTITYDQLAELVAIACSLAKQLRLITEQLHTYPDEKKAAAKKEALAFWSEALGGISR